MFKFIISLFSVDNNIEKLCANNNQQTMDRFSFRCYYYPRVNGDYPRVSIIHVFNGVQSGVIIIHVLLVFIHVLLLSMRYWCLFTCYNHSRVIEQPSVRIPSMVQVRR